MECGDLSPLWSAATCRGLVGKSVVKPPRAKAPTSRRTPNMVITYLSDQPDVSCIFVVLVSCDFVVSHLVLEPDHEKTRRKDQATRKHTKGLVGHSSM